MTEAFVDDNRAYEKWLRTQCEIVPSDLKHKHQRMQKSAFVFLRATYFRWARVIEELCPELTDAPAVLSVGDAHTENFGTWRDGDGRLVWGFNDFDEGSVMPYAFDLVRLTTSAKLAKTIKRDTPKLAAAILDGYRQGLEQPRPTIVDQSSSWTLPYVQPTDANAASFWDEINNHPEHSPPAEVYSAMTSSLPSGTSAIITFRRLKKGGGSLGRPRYVAIGQWQGGAVLREAKAWVPSAWDWIHGSDAAPDNYLSLAKGRYRSPDPFLDLPKGQNFTIRRLAPDSRKIDLGEAAGAMLHDDVLRQMGADLAAVHADHEPARLAILKDLKQRDDGWLREAVRKAVALVRADFDDWVSQS